MKNSLLASRLRLSVTREIYLLDAELEAADFTRDEVKEGVQELLKIYDQENFGTIFR